MATIRLPDLPPRLYRYCRLDRPHDIDSEIDALRRRYIYASIYRNMNDPMEGYYRPSARLKKEPQWRTTYKEVLEAKQTTGIACFSETFDNEIMWAHYADNFRGICIGYFARKLRDNLPPSAKLARIAYAEKPLYLSKYDQSDVIAAAQKILSQKKYNWAYEREWRLMADHPGQIPYQGDVIAEVYFGSRISAGDRQKIMSGMGARGIAFKQMKVVGYGHTWIKIDTPRIVAGRQL